LATLAGILIIVAYNMSEWRSFVSVLKGSRTDAAVLLTTFLLTILVDLTVAIEIGMVMAAFLFMRNMIKFSNVSILTKEMEDNGEGKDLEAIENYSIPPDVEVYEITGPLFFGAAYKFKDAMRFIEKRPKILIIRMRKVPIIDATGLKTIEEVLKELKQNGTKMILSEVESLQVIDDLKSSRLLFTIGKANVTTTFNDAVERSKAVLLDTPKKKI
jgi:SulP family sulfate permease